MGRTVEKFNRRLRRLIRSIKAYVDVKFFGGHKSFALWQYQPSHPTGLTPDNLVLTITDTPQNSQAVNWRTSLQVKDGVVQYRQKDAAAFASVRGHYRSLFLPELLGDATSHHFVAQIGGLAPNTVYQYRVGSPTLDAWSGYFEFKTAPEKDQPFEFICIGDLHEDYSGQTGKALAISAAHAPNASFYMFVGDIVNNGEVRNEWDTFLAGTKNLFAVKPLVAAIGNHDYHDIDFKGPVLFHKYFKYPDNGAMLLPKGHSYSFTYSNAYFIVLDTNKPVRYQTRWLRRQLRQARDNGYAWKIVMFHHPVFSSKRHRGKKALREKWAPLLNYYGADLVFSGHDHGYLRTKPIGGTTHIIATSNATHFYKMEQVPVAAFQAENLATYQKISIHGQQLTYQAYDFNGSLADKLILNK